MSDEQVRGETGLNEKSIEARKAEDDRADAQRREAVEQAERLAAERGDPADPMTVADAKVMAPVPEDMSAGDHMAQKFGNDPANPKPGSGVDVSDDAKTVRLSRITPDHPDKVVTNVQPEMVGDYIRAGWGRDIL